MSITLNDTLSAAKHILASANNEAVRAADTAKQAAGTAKDGAENAVTSARMTWLDGVKTVAGMVTMLRGFQASDALGWVGLTRRRSPVMAMGIFGAGMAVGAGAALLFAPMSGNETRRRIMNGFSGLKGDARTTLDAVGAEITADVSAAAARVEAVTAQAKSAVVAAEHEVEDRAVALKDVAATKIDAAVQAVKSVATTASHDAAKEVFRTTLRIGVRRTRKNCPRRAPSTSGNKTCGITRKETTQRHGAKPASGSKVSGLGLMPRRKNMGGDSRTAVSPSALAHAVHREPLQATFLAPRHSTGINFK